MHGSLNIRFVTLCYVR